jgi:hypothetical protein
LKCVIDFRHEHWFQSWNKNLSKFSSQLDVLSFHLQQMCLWFFLLQVWLQLILPKMETTRTFDSIPADSREMCESRICMRVPSHSVSQVCSTWTKFKIFFDLSKKKYPYEQVPLSPYVRTDRKTKGLNF